MALNTAALVNRLTSTLHASGLFTQVNGHEPKRAPDGHLTAAVWANTIEPVPATSGLAVTAAAVTFTIRLYTNMLAEPQDAIDPALITATDTILNNIHADFTFGGDVGFVDLLGQTGRTLAAVAGYLDIDGTLYRVIDITVPSVIFDAWSQTA